MRMLQRISLSVAECRRISLGLAMVALAGLLLAGCGRDQGAKLDDEPAKKDHHHDHPMEGPRNGPLVEWGHDEYHPEYLRDKDKKQMTVYILDGDAKKDVPIDAEEITVTITKPGPIEPITLKADPQEDDPEGKSSRFIGSHDRFGADEKLRGEISGKIGGKSYRGRFDEAKKHVH